jgi:hypothetical protein
MSELGKGWPGIELEAHIPIAGLPCKRLRQDGQKRGLDDIGRTLSLIFYKLCA